MIVWLDPPERAPATLAADVRLVAVLHPGGDFLKIRAGGHVLVFGERVDALSSELVTALEELDFTVGIEA